MKHLSSIFSLLLLMITYQASAQQPADAFRLGTTQDFLKQLKQKAEVNQYARTTDGATISVRVSATQTLSLQVNVQQTDAVDQLTLIGSLADKQDGSFYIRIDGEELIGNIIDRVANKAYQYASDEQGQATVEEKAIEEVICASPEGKIGMVREDSAPTAAEVAPVAQVVSLESLPGAPTCIYLDFDGEYVVNTPWEEGRPINAAPSNMNNDQIRETWEIVTEDFLPYQVNVTTNRAVFDRYPSNRRMQCIVTPTKTVVNNARSVLGVAFVGSFDWNIDAPCWSFGLDPKRAGEAASHEIGHTVDLSHDDVNGEGYYGGHGQWAAIMGNGGFSKPISQWSKGEYAVATNREDDLAIIASYLSYRGDDHAGNTPGATNISIGADGSVAPQSGIIGRTNDRDFFRLECGTGNVVLDISTIGVHSNLETSVDLYEGQSGQLIGRFNGESGRDTRLETRLNAGVYYLAVDGVGALDPRTNGFSDYGSLGFYRITGRAPVGSSSSPVATFYQDCDFQGKSFTLAEGNYDLSALRTRGYTNDQLSSLRVPDGYEVVLYDDNPFGGRALVALAGSVACLVDYSFNDIASSVIVRRAGSDGNNASQQIEAEDYSAMAGVQIENGSEGQNVGYIDQGDWMTFNGINFPTTGDYLIEYRVASLTGGGRLSLDLDAGATVLGEIDIPNTGGWQNWTTVSQTVRVNAGTYNLGIYAPAGNWNINWFRITPQGAAVAARQGEAPDKLVGLTDTMTSPEEAIVLYPNPVVSQMRLVAPSDAWQDGKMSIINVQGQRVWEGNFQKTMDMSQFKTGIYSVVLDKPGQRLVRRFIKQ